MARTERNRSRFQHDGAVRDDDGSTGGNGRADLDLKSGSDWIHPLSSEGDDSRGLTCRLRRMYRDMAEEPLPETFNTLVQRLRGANNNGSGNGSQ